MDHSDTSIALSAARQRAVIAIASQKQQIVNEANKAIAELDESLSDLAATYAAAAGLDGEWTFANDDTGGVVLRKVEKELADAALPAPSA